MVNALLADWLSVCDLPLGRARIKIPVDERTFKIIICAVLLILGFSLIAKGCAEIRSRMVSFNDSHQGSSLLLHKMFGWNPESPRYAALTGRLHIGMGIVCLLIVPYPAYLLVSDELERRQIAAVEEEAKKPYRATRKDPQNPPGKGIETNNPVNPPRNVIPNLPASKEYFGEKPSRRLNPKPPASSPPPARSSGGTSPRGPIRKMEDRNADREPPKASAPAPPAFPAPLGPVEPLGPIEYSGAPIFLGDDIRGPGEIGRDDLPPPGGVLVGLHIWTSDFGPRREVFGLQPLWQAGSQLVEGARFGEPGPEVETILARPGYAVTQLVTASTVGIDGIQLVFCRVNGDRLDPADRYESKWVGSDSMRTSVLGNGKDFIIGLRSPLEGFALKLLVGQVDRFEDTLPSPHPLPWLAYSANSSRLAILLDANRIANYADRAPDGGVLVGMRINPGRINIDGFQPIYQVADRYEAGKWCGAGSDTAQLLLANPGYVVGNIQISWLGAVAAMRLKFMRINEEGADREDTYISDWVGSGRGRPGDSPTIDRPIIGLDVNYDSGSIQAFGFYPVSVQVSQSPPGGAGGTATEFRIWKSADGKYTVEARMSALDGSTVVLEKKDGTTVRVPLNRLGDPDRRIAIAAGAAADK